jgi:hypothetical protein
MNDLTLIMGIIILGLIVLFNLLWYMLKHNSTEYKETEIFVLKNELPANYYGGTDKPFNLIDGIDEFRSSKVSINKTEKYVFNKLVNTKLSIKEYWGNGGCDDYGDL